MKIQVQIVQGPDADCTFTVEKNSNCVVGRGEEADFQVENDELISRKHFVIGFDGSVITLTDLGSTNGTFVDGHALVKGRTVFLNNGQSFIAGRVSKFVVSLAGQTQHPTPPAPAGAPELESSKPQERNPQTNFGSSIFIAGDVPAQIPPSSPDSAGGNFSQSIVQGISARSGLGDDSDFGGATDRSDLLFVNPAPVQGIKLGDSGSSGPLPSEPCPIPSSAEYELEAPDPQDNLDPGLDYQGSIAIPGDIDNAAYDFPPLEGDDSDQPASEPIQQTPQPPAPQTRPPLPTKVVEEHPPTSPFASVQQAGMPPIDDSPAESLPNQPSASAVVEGSIYTPGQENRARADFFVVADSSVDDASICLPNQLPTDPDKQGDPRSSSQISAIPLGKGGFIVRELSNGLFVHSGADESDLPLVLAALQQGFESVYCAHLSRTGIETPAVASQPHKESKLEPEETEIESNFENMEDQSEVASAQSPFESLDIEGSSPDSPEPTKPPTHRIGVPLFDWLPTEARWDFPILLTNEEFTFELKEFWNADALVCLFGSSAKQLSEHFQEMIRTDLRTGKKGKGIFGCCWPTVLHAALESQGEKAVNRVFEGGVAAILMEDPLQEFAWIIIGKSDLTEYLSDFGFVRQSSE